MDFLHTGLDDLESFVWVIIYAILKKGRAKRHKKHDETWLGRLLLKSRDVLFVKRHIEAQILEMAPNSALSDKSLALFSPLLYEYRPLLFKMFELARDGRMTILGVLSNHDVSPVFGINILSENMKRRKDALDEKYTDYAIKYLRAAMDFRDNYLRSHNDKT